MTEQATVEDLRKLTFEAIPASDTKIPSPNSPLTKSSLDEVGLV